jgi:hypothetical protein
MTALNPLLAKVFRGPLDLNGPVRRSGQQSTFVAPDA